jgi:hypothetical protein
MLRLATGPSGAPTRLVNGPFTRAGHGDGSIVRKPANRLPTGNDKGSGLRRYADMSA